MAHADLGGPVRLIEPPDQHLAQRGSSRDMLTVRGDLDIPDVLWCASEADGAPGPQILDCDRAPAICIDDPPSGSVEARHVDPSSSRQLRNHLLRISRERPCDYARAGGACDDKFISS